MIFEKSYKYIQPKKFVKILLLTHPETEAKLARLICKLIANNFGDKLKRITKKKNMFISLDLETTGLNPSKDKIIEFGAIKFDEDYFEKTTDQHETLQLLINPGTPLPHIITHITNLTDEDLKEAPSFDEVKEKIKNFIGDLPIVGHNIKFDTDFLQEKGIELKNPEYDTHELASLILPNLNSYSLEVLSQLLKIKHQEKHRALDDSIAAAELFLKLTEKFRELDPNLAKKIEDLLQKSQLPIKNLLLNILKDSDVNPSLQKKVLPKKDSPPIPENTQNKAEKILEEKDPAIFEEPPPFEDLIRALAKNAPPEAYISLPSRTFHQIEPTMPDTLAKIDLPKNYISPERLAEFQKKQSLENHEISALIKYLIWIEKTSTGILHEVRLIQNEKETIDKVNINEHILPAEKEPFFKKAIEKDVTSAAICTHSYLIENQEILKNISQNPSAIIVNIENFHNTLKRTLSGYIRLEEMEQKLKNLRQLEPSCTAVESLLSKSAILFGFIGIIFEKYKDNNEFSQVCTISENISTDKNWLSAKNTVENLIKISIDLGEIKNSRTQIYLEEWKKTLKELHRIFHDTDIQNNLIWIEKDFNGELVTRRIPVNIKTEMEKFIKNFENCKFIGQSLELSDSGDFIKKIFEIPTQTKFLPSKKQSETTEIVIADDIDDRDFNQIPNFLIKYFSKKDENAAIICNSKKQLEYFTLKLGRNSIPVISQTTGSISKVKDQFQQNPITPVLLTPFGWEDFEDHKEIETLIIHKIPFDPPSNPYIITSSRNWEDSFNEFQVPRAILNLKKSIDLLIGHNTKTLKKVIILDSRIVNKNYGDRFLQMLREITPSAYTTKLEKILN